jgi:hypothetical protein
MFQMLAHLTVMSWQRNALLNASIPFRNTLGPNRSRLKPHTVGESDVPAIDSEDHQTRPLLTKLIDVILNEETNVKLKQAALDLLGALCKDNDELAREVMILILRKSKRKAMVPQGWVSSLRSPFSADIAEFKMFADVPNPKKPKGVALVYDELVGSRSNGIAVSAACWSVVSRLHETFSLADTD